MANGRSATGRILFWSILAFGLGLGVLTVGLLVALRGQQSPQAGTGEKPPGAARGEADEAAERAQRARPGFGALAAEAESPEEFKALSDAAREMFKRGGAAQGDCAISHGPTRTCLR